MSLTTTEENIDWMANLMNYAYKEGIAAMDVDEVVEKEWSQHVEETADKTLMNKVESWFSGANIEGKAKPKGYLYYLGGIPKYIELCTEEGRQEYPSFNRLGKLEPNKESSLQG